YQANGLNSSHVVALFSGTGASAVPVVGGSVTVPAGTAGTYKDGYRFAPLAAPVTLPPGNYAVVVYQLNGGSSSDGYGQGATGFIGGGDVADTGNTYNFDSTTYPVFPYGTQGAGNLATCSFTYSPLFLSSDTAPIALAPGSFNADAVVEASV